MPPKSLIENFRERINVHGCPSRKDDLFPIRVQREAASPHFTVGIGQQKRRRDVAVIGNVPHGDASFSSSEAA